MASIKPTESENDLIAGLDEKRVRLTKYIVILVFFISATVVSAATYIFTRESEKNSFEIEVSQPQRGILCLAPSVLRFDSNMLHVSFVSTVVMWRTLFLSSSGRLKTISPSWNNWLPLLPPVLF